MTSDRLTAPLVGGVALLERAMGYTLGSLQLVTPEAIASPTPCEAWDLWALLQHMNDSLEALHEAVDVGQVSLCASASFGDPATDPVAGLRNRACSMLGAWANTGDGTISVAGPGLSASVVSATGAVEIAVHGWDVSASLGRPRPIPAALAEELLPLASVLVSGSDRPVRFAAPVAASVEAGPGDRLLAFLGRDARRAS